MDVEEESLNSPPEAATGKLSAVPESMDSAAKEEQVSSTTETSPLPSAIASQVAHTMAPPPVPRPKHEPLSQNPPRSGQGSGVATPQASQHPPLPQSPEASDEESTTSSVGNPDESLESFDWQALEQRYHDRIQELNANEQNVLGEFNDLCQYFSIWAETGAQHETGRSFKRLKTQMELVQHREDELENKRAHYVKVVEAFKRALDLLRR